MTRESFEKAKKIDDLIESTKFQKTSIEKVHDQVDKLDHVNISVSIVDLHDHSCGEFVEIKKTNVLSMLNDQINSLTVKKGQLEKEFEKL